MNPYIQALHILAIGTVGGIVFSALLYLVTSEPTWWPWYREYKPPPMPPATYAPTSARHMATLQRIAARMRREATTSGYASSYGYREIGRMELRNDGASQWTLRVQRPLLIPHSRYADAFGVPTGTAEQQNQHWVFWYWSEPVHRPQQTTALVSTAPIPLFPERLSQGRGAAIYWRIRAKTRRWYQRGPKW